MIEQVIFLMQPQATIHNIEITFQFQDENLSLYCIPHQIKQVVINLIKNALEGY